MAEVFRPIVNIQPQTISTGGARQLLDLAGKLDQFSNQAAEFSAKKQVSKATIEGAQAGIEQQQAGGALELKKSLFGGVGVTAFNEAARNGYLKSLDNDNIETITNIAGENETDLAGFNDAVESYSKGVMRGVDPASKAQVSLSLDSMISRHRPKIQQAQAEKVVKEANAASAVNATERGILAQKSAFDGDVEQAGLNLAAAINSINERTDIGPEKKAILTREVQKEERESSFSGELSREFDEEGPQAAYDSLDKMAGSPPKGFTLDEWDAFVKKEQTKINRKVQRQNIDAKKLSKEQERKFSIARGMTFLDPSIPADPAKSGDDRKDVNLAYDELSLGWGSLPPEMQMQNNIDFVNNTGIVPDAMIANTNAAMRSGQADQVLAMADYVSRLQETSPQSLKDMPDESRAMALQIVDAQRAGMDVDVAMVFARKNTYGLTDTEKDVIRVKTQEVSKDLDGALQTRVNSDTDEGGFDTGLFSNVPDVPPSMLGDYRNSFGRFMVLTGGDEDQSQKLAYDASVKNVWAVTETGGPKRFMKYAPEAIYNIQGIGTDWIEEQFNEEMEIAGADGAIMATDTSVARSETPSYPILVTNPVTGVVEPMRAPFSIDENTIKSDARFGELGRIENSDGSISTEFSITENVPELGGFVNIPTLVEGQTDLSFLETKKLTPDNIKIAINRAIQRKKEGALLPSFGSMEEAVKSAENRSESEKNAPFRGGELLSYKPDFKATEQYRELVAAPGELLEKSKARRERLLIRRASVIRRGVQSRVLGEKYIPINERKAFLASDEGKKSINRAIRNMIATDRIDEVEAAEARKAFNL